MPNSTNRMAYVYSDGSYTSKHPDVVGAGWVIVDGETKQVKQEARCYNVEPDVVAMRNVGGEIVAARHGLEDCKAFGYSKAVLRHDYEGIGAWPQMIWQATKPETIAYVRFVWALIKGGFSVIFEHVKGHSGDLFNERADYLAKQAIEDYAKEEKQC